MKNLFVFVIILIIVLVISIAGKLSMCYTMINCIIVFSFIIMIIYYSIHKGKRTLIQGDTSEPDGCRVTVPGTQQRELVVTTDVALGTVVHTGEHVNGKTLSMQVATVLCIQSPHASKERDAVGTGMANIVCTETTNLDQCSTLVPSGDDSTSLV